MADVTLKNALDALKKAQDALTKVQATLVAALEAAKQAVGDERARLLGDLPEIQQKHASAEKTLADIESMTMDRFLARLKETGVDEHMARLREQIRAENEAA